jgi:hypothetical protein
MDWLQQRYSDNGNSTQGLFFMKASPPETLHKWMCHSLEDEFRKDKVRGETRTDAGRFELKIAKFVEPRVQVNHGFKIGDYLSLTPGKLFVKANIITEFVVDGIVDKNSFFLDTLTPLTKKHRENYNNATFGNWFKHHIEITGLPRHKAVYLHAGNNEKHTDACLLLGDTMHNHTIEKDKMERSIQACKRFYEICYPYLESGKRSYIEIRDEIHLV